MRKLLVAAIAVAAVGFLALMLFVRFGPPTQERRDREAVIQPLLKAHATREQVVQALGLPFVDYSLGSTNRWVIEQRVSDPGVRQRADRYPGLLFHTTMDWMTWLFFDSEDRLQDYYLCVQ
jgi:hypothetical protein